MLISSRRVYTGRIINLDIDTVAFPNGSTGELEMIRHPGASAVVPFIEDPARTRPAGRAASASSAMPRTDTCGRCPPDGSIRGKRRRTAPGASSRKRRGSSARELRRLTTIYTTPGFTDERIHLFLAHDLEPGASRPEADEFVEVHRLRWSAVLGLICRGEIVDGKTLAVSHVCPMLS